MDIDSGIFESILSVDDIMRLATIVCNVNQLDDHTLCTYRVRGERVTNRRHSTPHPAALLPVGLSSDRTTVGLGEAGRGKPVHATGHHESGHGALLRLGSTVGASQRC